MTSEVRINIFIRLLILVIAICISSIYCKVQRDCLFRTPQSVANEAIPRNKAIPLSGPNINEIDKFNERMELIKKVKRKMEIKSQQKNKSKSEKSEKTFDQSSIKVPLLIIKDSEDK